MDSKLKSPLSAMARTNIIVQTEIARYFGSFTFVSFLNIFSTNMTAIFIKDIRAKVQIKINIASGLSRKALSLLLIMIK